VPLLKSPDILPTPEMNGDGEDYYHRISSVFFQGWRWCKPHTQINLRSNGNYIRVIVELNQCWRNVYFASGIVQLPPLAPARYSSKALGYRPDNAFEVAFLPVFGSQPQQSCGVFR